MMATTKSTATEAMVTAGEAAATDATRAKTMMAAMVKTTAQTRTANAVMMAREATVMEP